MTHSDREIDFKALFESVPGLYLILSPDLTIIAVNDAYAAATLTRREDIIGRGLFDVFPDNPDDHTADGVSNLRASLQHVLRNKTAHTMAVQKYDIRRADGTFEERYWSPINKPVLDSNNEVRYIIHRVEDVTDLVRMQKEQASIGKAANELQARLIEKEAEVIRRSQEIQKINEGLEQKVAERTAELERLYLKQSVIFDSLPAHIALVDESGMIVTVNEAWKKFARENELKGFNYSIGDNYIDVCACATGDDKEIAGEMAAKLSQVLKGELSQFSLEYPCHSPKEQRWFRAEVRPQIRGQQMGAVIMHINITERKLAEEAMSKAMQEIGDYKFALDESSIVAVTDQRGIIQHVNDNFCRISKYSREELIGQDHRIINSGHHSKDFIRRLWATISIGKIWKGELKNKAKDGTIYWVDKTIVPFLDEHRRPYKYLAIRSDITARKLAEESILELNQNLENKVTARTLELAASLEREQSLNVMKSRFVSMASHEFRTPLSTILSSLSLVTAYDKEGQEEKRRKHVDRIKSSVKNLTEILNDFLSIEKLEQGKVEIVKDTFDLNEFCASVIEDVNGMLKKGQYVTFTGSGDMEVVQDKKILKNIFLNLLSNAIKYSGEDKEIVFSADVSRGLITICIKDNGIGIPLADQQNLFGQFFRATNVDAIQGTGLGLNIVKRYVELLNGDISFTSVQGEGTTFTVQLPARLS